MAFNSPSSAVVLFLFKQYVFLSVFIYRFLNYLQIPITTVSNSVSQVISIYHLHFELNGLEMKYHMLCKPLTFRKTHVSSINLYIPFSCVYLTTGL